MRIYRIRIIADKYPTEYDVNASSWGTAISRATKEWQKRFRRSRADKLTITAVKSGVLLQTNGDENEKDCQP